MKTCHLVLLAVSGACWYGAQYVLSSAAVYGFEGREVTIRCPYESGYQTHTKYVCVGRCSTAHAKLEVQGGETKLDGRYFLSDDNRARVVTLAISRLTMSDSGKYICGVETFWHTKQTSLELIVRTLITVTGFLGKSVSLTCKYYSSHSQSHIKYFCKGQEPASCRTITTMTRDRFYLADTPSQNTYMLTFNYMSARDPDIYWCVEVCDRINFYTSAVQLLVSSALTTTSPTTITVSATPFLQKSSTPSPSSSSPSSSSSSTRSSSPPPSPPSSLTSSSSSSSSSSSDIGLSMAISVAMALLLVGAVYFSFHRYNASRGQGVSFKCGWRNTDTETNRQMADTNYEDVTDINQPPPPKLTTVYAVTQLPNGTSLPTNPSDDTIYCNTQLPRNLFDNPVYSSVQLSGDTIYSNTLPITPYRDTMYSNTPLPKIPFDNCTYSAAR